MKYNIYSYCYIYYFRFYIYIYNGQFNNTQTTMLIYFRLKFGIVITIYI